MFPNVTAGRAPIAKALMEELGVCARPLATRYKQRSYAFVPPNVGQVLEVGCGTGDDVLALAERCGPATFVVGLDRRLDLIEEATRRARTVALNVRFGVGDAQSLPFASGSFDVVWADRLFVEGNDVKRVLTEIVRVTRVGGRVVLHEHQASLWRGDGPPGAAPSAPWAAQLERAGLVSVELLNSWPWTDGQGSHADQVGISVLGFKPAADA